MNIDYVRPTSFGGKLAYDSNMNLIGTLLRLHISHRKTTWKIYEIFCE